MTSIVHHTSSPNIVLIDILYHHWTLWNSWIPGIIGILGRDVAVSQHPLWNSGIPGIMGILGRDVRNTHCGIPEFRELWEFWEEMFATPPVEFQNSGNYGNFGKRYNITGPSAIPEFREFWEFWAEMTYHWAIWNSGILGILGRDVILQDSL